MPHNDNVRAPVVINKRKVSELKRFQLPVDLSEITQTTADRCYFKRTFAFEQIEAMQLQSVTETASAFYETRNNKEKVRKKWLLKNKSHSFPGKNYSQKTAHTPLSGNEEQNPEE